MKLNDEMKPLYLGADAPGEGPGANLLQTRGDMSCHRDDTPDNNKP